jgi:HAD superfamily hydrolase (TIGR01549 family)
MLRGVIFDLDGTLVDSQLDFEAMRVEMGLSEGLPILEALETMDAAERERCLEILHRHEHEGAERATLIPGVIELHSHLTARQVPQAVVTRNARHLALRVLERLQLRFDPIVGREDGPVKPDPAAIFSICEQWKVSPSEVVVIGDYLFDIEAGRRAGARTVLFTQGREPHGLPGAAEADHVVRHFAEIAPDWFQS